jgi:SprT protein
MNRDDILEFVYRMWDSIKMTYNLKDPTYPKVEWFQKSQVAGKAWYDCGNYVSFNEILALENGSVFKNTIAHELAHLVTFQIYPDRKQNHGPEFRSVMQTLGYSPSTYHTYDISSVASKRIKIRYEYVCRECGKHMEVATPTHTKISSKGGYVCKCGGHISFTGKKREFV